MPVGAIISVHMTVFYMVQPREVKPYAVVVIVMVVVIPVSIAMPLMFPPIPGRIISPMMMIIMTVTL